MAILPLFFGVLCLQAVSALPVSSSFDEKCGREFDPICALSKGREITFDSRCQFECRKADEPELILMLDSVCRGTTEPIENEFIPAADVNSLPDEAEIGLGIDPGVQEQSSGENGLDLKTESENDLLTDGESDQTLPKSQSKIPAKKSKSEVRHIVISEPDTPPREDFRSSEDITPRDFQRDGESDQTLPKSQSKIPAKKSKPEVRQIARSEPDNDGESDQIPPKIQSKIPVAKSKSEVRQIAKSEPDTQPRQETDFRSIEADSTPRELQRDFATNRGFSHDFAPHSIERHENIMPRFGEDESGKFRHTFQQFYRGASSYPNLNVEFFERPIIEDREEFDDLYTYSPTHLTRFFQKPRSDYLHV